MKNIFIVVLFISNLVTGLKLYYVSKGNSKEIKSTNDETVTKETKPEKKKTNQLYITEYTGTIDNIKTKRIAVSKEYINVDLELMDEGYYRGEVESEIETMVTNGNETKPARFKTHAEFINHMFESGYEVMSKQPKRYGAIYTFKKK